VCFAFISVTNGKEKKMKDFKKFGGEVIFDLGQYVREYVLKHKEVKIYVGCDSEQYNNHTQYAVVVVLYHEGNGAHYIFRRERTKKVKEMFTRLWGEVERVLELADYLEKELDGVYKRENPLEKLVEIHIDLNPSPMHKSNVVFNAGVGTCKGQGYRVKTKPHAFAASVCADLICRK
jgi:uncharacterized protein